MKWTWDWSLAKPLLFLFLCATPVMVPYGPILPTFSVAALPSEPSGVTTEGRYWVKTSTTLDVELNVLSGLYETFFTWGCYKNPAIQIVGNSDGTFYLSINLPNGSVGIAVLSSDLTTQNMFFLNEYYSNAFVLSLELDQLGNLIVSGITAPHYYDGIYQVCNRTPSEINLDIFILKMSPTGGVEWNQTIGGSRVELLSDVFLDHDDNVWFTGKTESEDVIMVNPVQNYFGGIDDVLVGQLTSSGEIAFLSYLGGEAEDVGKSLVVDVNQNVFLTGHTTSADFPTKNLPVDFLKSVLSTSRYNMAEHEPQGFLWKYNAGSNETVFSCFVKGPDPTHFGHGVKLAWDDSQTLFLGETTVYKRIKEANLFKISWRGETLTSAYDYHNLLPNTLHITPSGDLLVLGMAISPSLYDDEKNFFSKYQIPEDYHDRSSKNVGLLNLSQSNSQTNFFGVLPVESSEMMDLTVSSAGTTLALPSRVGDSWMPALYQISPRPDSTPPVIITKTEEYQLNQPFILTLSDPESKIWKYSYSLGQESALVDLDSSEPIFNATIPLPTNLSVPTNLTVQATNHAGFLTEKEFRLIKTTASTDYVLFGLAGLTFVLAGSLAAGAVFFVRQRSQASKPDDLSPDELDKYLKSASEVLNEQDLD